MEFYHPGIDLPFAHDLKLFDSCSVVKVYNRSIKSNWKYSVGHNTVFPFVIFSTKILGYVKQFDRSQYYSCIDLLVLTIRTA